MRRGTGKNSSQPRTYVWEKFFRERPPALRAGDPRVFSLRASCAMESGEDAAMAFVSVIRGLVLRLTNGTFDRPRPSWREKTKRPGSSALASDDYDHWKTITTCLSKETSSGPPRSPRSPQIPIRPAKNVAPDRSWPAKRLQNDRAAKIKRAAARSIDAPVHFNPLSAGFVPRVRFTACRFTRD